MGMLNKKSDVQLMLLERGISQASIAEALSISTLTVGLTLRRKSHNQTIQDHTARELGADPTQLWREDYAPIYRKTRFNKYIERKNTSFRDNIQEKN